LFLVSLHAARRGAAFFTAVEAKCKISLTSPNECVDQRKSPGCRALIGRASPAKAAEQSGQND
jgi:hypothetical protein